MAQDPLDESIVGFTPEEFEHGINPIFYIAMTIIPLNMSGSCYVFYRVLSIRKRQRSIPASLRLPFYIVFIDLLCSFTFFSEMIHLYVTRKPPEQPLSSILGGCLTFVIVSNFVLVTQAAFFSWNRVVRRKPIDHGPYDVKLLAPAVAVATIVVTVFAATGSLGANNYVAFVKKSASGVSVFLAICVLTSLAALWFFYVWIMLEIFKVSRGSFLTTIIAYRPTNSKKAQQIQQQLQQPQEPQQFQQLQGQGSNNSGQVESETAGSENMKSGSSQISMIERQIIAKICMYMLGCFLQYSPGTPYAISYLFPRQPYVLYIMAIISINLGGIVNATALVLNEGLGRIAKSRDGQSTSQFPSSMPDGSAGSSGQLYRSNITVTADTQSWGRVPSFTGILVNPQTQIDNNGNHPLYTPDSPKHLYTNPAIAPRSPTTSYNAVWEPMTGPSPYPMTPQTSTPQRMYPPPVPPIPPQYSSGVTVTRTPSGRSSEYSNAATVVDVGSSAVSEAYANMARFQQQRRWNP